MALAGALELVRVDRLQAQPVTQRQKFSDAEMTLQDIEQFVGFRGSQVFKPLLGNPIPEDPAKLGDVCGAIEKPQRFTRLVGKITVDVR